LNFEDSGLHQSHHLLVKILWRALVIDTCRDLIQTFACYGCIARW